MPKKSKRENNIARASLAVYPVSDAFDTFIAGAVIVSPIHRILPESTFFPFSTTTNELTSVSYIDVTTQGNREGATCRFHGLNRTTLTLSRAPSMSHWYDEKFHRTIESGGYNRDRWMNNFALMALDLHSARIKARQAHTLHKLLVEKQLPRRPCWSRALAEMVAVKRTDTGDIRLHKTGFLKASLTPKQWEKSGISLSMLIRFAENFTPTSAPVPNRAVGGNRFWADTFPDIFVNNMNTGKIDPPHHICLTSENANLKTLKESQ